MLGLLALCHSTWGEDQIRLKNGEVLRGTATKFDEGSMTLTFKFDKGTLGYSQADLAEVILTERPGVVEGRKAFAEGNLDEVVSNWKGPVGEFMGVDNPWVLECTGGLGQTYLAQGKVAEAEALYGKMKKFYPTGPAACPAGVSARGGFGGSTGGVGNAGGIYGLQPARQNSAMTARNNNGRKVMSGLLWFALM